MDEGEQLDIETTRLPVPLTLFQFTNTVCKPTPVEGPIIEPLVAVQVYVHVPALLAQVFTAVYKMLVPGGAEDVYVPGGLINTY